MHETDFADFTRYRCSFRSRLDIIEMCLIVELSSLERRRTEPIMVDTFTPEKRSRLMASIKGKDTAPERIVRKWLWKNGYRYRLHGKHLPGCPDLVFAGRKKVIFIHGCFWHSHNCPKFKRPKSNTEFWDTKLAKNKQRDRRNLTQLTKLGWKYLVIWECQLRPKACKRTWKKIMRFLDEG